MLNGNKQNGKSLIPNSYTSVKISKKPYICKNAYITYSDNYDKHDSCNTRRSS